MLLEINFFRLRVRFYNDFCGNDQRILLVLFSMSEQRARKTQTSARDVHSGTLLLIQLLRQCRIDASWRL